MNQATHAFSILGHPGRLAVFRLLMRLAPTGARPTDMAATLDLRQNTLSGHLSDLVATGLITVRRDGRTLIYSANLQAARDIVGYLVNDCCRGRADICDAVPSSRDSAMTKAPLNVLFLCSGNSVRSIFAEAILNRRGAGRFRAYSAGTRPGSVLNPFAVELLERKGFDVSGLHAKHVEVFSRPDAPRMDFVFTVCDAAASEECGPWPDQPLTAHWGVADPVKATGTDAEKALAFASAFDQLDRRIAAFASLSPDKLDRLSLQHRLDEIGRT